MLPGKHPLVEVGPMEGQSNEGWICEGDIIPAGDIAQGREEGGEIPSKGATIGRI